ncbi:MAG: ribosome maturation factor RimM [Gammaproteobacteria bacterium]
MHSGQENDTSSWIALARIGRPHGLKGWVRIHTITEQSKSIRKYRTFWLLGKQPPFQIEATGFALSGSHLIAVFSHCSSREQAESLLCNQWLHVPKQDLPKPAAGEYYWYELIGLKVLTHAGVALGIVENLIETGAQDVLVIRNGSEQKLLIPWAVSHLNIEVDRDKGEIKLDWDAEWR